MLRGLSYLQIMTQQQHLAPGRNRQALDDQLNALQAQKGQLARQGGGVAMQELLREMGMTQNRSPSPTMARIDFPNFLLLMRWMLDVDFCSISSSKQPAT